MKNLHNYLYRYQIYISGEIPNCDNYKLKSYLEDNYDLMCYNSKKEDKNEDKLVSMMGARLMIVMYQNNENQNKEINTARKLKIPILFINNLEEDITDYEVNNGEYKIVFQKLEDVGIILKDRFKLIKEIKKRKDLPFKTLGNETKLFIFSKINSISILKEKNKLILAGDKIKSYNLEGEKLEAIETPKFNEGQLNACVNNKDKEIIILNNRVFSKYNFDFYKISEDKLLEVEDIINEIFVNEENKHVYGISNNSNKLYHFDEEFKIKQIIDISSSLLIKVLNNHVYMLLKGYLNSNIERNNTSQIIEYEDSFIGVYTQKENKFIKFKRKIILNVLVEPIDFHVDENFIFLFTTFINKYHLFNRKPHVLIFDHDGILLQKTGLDLHFDKNTRFLVGDYQTIYCAIFRTKFFCNRFMNTEYIVEESKVEEYIQKKNEFMKERKIKAVSNILLTIAITLLYYADVITDLLLCWKYYKDGDIMWFRITLGIVVFSSLFNTLVLIYYSYLQEFKFNWKNKEYMRVVIKSFCLLFQLEMLLW
jgi:hypothetical protein